MTEDRFLRVAFLCTHNSGRSQMAEALMREDWAGSAGGVEAFSAGVVARGVHPMAIRALALAGVNAEGLRSKTVEDLCSEVRRTVPESDDVGFERTVGSNYAADAGNRNDSPGLSRVDAGSPQLFDVVVTVCDNARDVCPFLPANKLNLHRQFSDPSTHSTGEQEQVEAFCDVRDQIRQWLAEVVPGWLRL